MRSVLSARVAQSVAHRTYEAVSPELCEGSQFESGRGQIFFYRQRSPPERTCFSHALVLALIEPKTYPTHCRHDQWWWQIVIHLPNLLTVQKFIMDLDSLNPIDALGHIETLIGAAASSIISSPEHNLSKLRDLLICLNKTELGPFKAATHKKTIVGLHRLIAKAATKVFLDVIPNYRIKQTETEESSKISRDVLQLRQFERNLCSIYKNCYLDYLKRMLDCVKSKPSSSFYTHLVGADLSDRQALAETAVECFGLLLTAHPHFNFRDQLIENLVEFNSQTKHEICAQQAHKYLCNVLRQDKLGEVSLEITSSICNLAKKRKLSLSSSLFKTLLELRLIDVKTADKEAREKKKAEHEKLAAMKKKQSRKEKKRMKKMKKLKNELLETEAHTTTDQKLKYHKTILRKLFVTYFRLLRYHEDLQGEVRETKKFVKLLPPVLEGVAKFAHLIDLKLCNDMFPLINKLLSNRDITTNCKLHCLCTVFVIYKSLETELEKVDPESFYKHFYVILTNLNAPSMSISEFSSMNSCIHLMLIKRARLVSNRRYCAFVRRLLVIALNIPSQFVPKLLETVRILFLQRPQLSALLDSSNLSDFGAGQFDIDNDDPDFSYADCSVAWELHLLRCHTEPIIRECAVKYVENSL